MRIFFTTTCIFLSFSGLFAQIKTGKKLVKKKQYEAAQQAFELDLQDDKNAAIAAWELANLYNIQEFENNNYDKARSYAQQSLNLLEKAPTKYHAYLQKEGVSILYIQKFLNDLTVRYYDSLMKAPTVETLDHFLADYPDRSTTQNETAQKRRNELAWQEALALDRYMGYEQLMKRYASSYKQFNPSLWEALQHKLYQKHAAEKGLYAIGDFIALYPQNPYSLDSIGAVKFLLAAQKNNEETYLNYVENYSKSPFVNLAADSLLRICERENDPARYDRWLRRFKGHTSEKRAWRGFWLLYKKESDWASFVGLYPHCPYTQKELESDK